MKHDLVKLSDVIPGISVELIYSTKGNFTGAPVYPLNAGAYLCKLPAFRLKLVQEALKKRGLSLKLWDGYRPFSVQKIFWEHFPDPRYIGDPAIGSKHNRGAAIDLTLVDENGNELPMQSPFDDFSIRAHRDYTDCNPSYLKNVQVLTEAMEQAGFLTYFSEWWHFEDPDWACYPILDISFEELS
jgi:D-alanyl-D-alanine dipeptidase